MNNQSFLSSEQCALVFSTDMLERDDDLDKTSTMQPFAPGDIFLGCSYMNHPVDDHAGPGRILQYDKDLNYKGVLWTRHTTHHVRSVKWGKDGLLWAFDLQNHRVIHVTPDGKQKPLHHFADRPLVNVNFGHDGSIYMTEGIYGTQGCPQTCFKPVADYDGEYGRPVIHKFDKNWNPITQYTVEKADEFAGFRCITHAAIHPSGDFLTYTTETGKRIMRFNLKMASQMPDLLTLTGELMDRNWVVAVEYLSDGRLLVTRGQTMDVLDEKGQTLRSYALPDYGWANVTVDAQNHFALLANVFTGKVIKLMLDNGKVVGEIDTGLVNGRRALAGVACYPG